MDKCMKITYPYKNYHETVKKAKWLGDWKRVLVLLNCQHLQAEEIILGFLNTIEYWPVKKNHAKCLVNLIRSMI